MNPRWLWRMSMWVRRPPSRQRQILVAVTLGICAILFAVETFIGWPDWATAHKMRGGFKF